MECRDGFHRDGPDKFKTDREIAQTGETAHVGAGCSAADVPKFDMDSEAGFVL